MNHSISAIKKRDGGIDEWTNKHFVQYQKRSEVEVSFNPDKIVRTSGIVQIGTTADPEFDMPKPTLSSVSSISPHVYYATPIIDDQLEPEIFPTINIAAARIQREIYDYASSRIFELQKIRRQRKMHQYIDALFCTAKDQVFEDGMESEFSRNLVSIVKIYRSDAVKSIHAFINEDKGNAEVLSEALRWLGHMEDPNTHNERRWLLESCLSSPSAIIRDGAILGLAFLNDHGSIASLEKAIQKETLEELKKDMIQIVEELQRTTE